MRLPPSALTTAQDCLAHWKRVYLEQQPDPAAFLPARGNAIDAALNKLARARMEGKPVYAAQLQGWLAAAWPADMRKVTDIPEGALPVAQDMLIAAATILRRVEPLHSQDTYVMPLCGDWELSGRVDLVAKYDGRVLVIDYKTSERLWSGDKLLSQNQPALYAALYEHRHGVLPEFAFVVTTPEGADWLPVHINRHVVDEALADARAVAARIDTARASGEWPKGKCAWCPLKGTGKEC